MNTNTAVDMEDDHNNNQSEPSAAQLELAREHARAEEAAAQRAKLESESKQLESEILKIKFDQSLKAAFEKCRAKFYPDMRSVLKLLPENVRIGPMLDGTCRVEVNGKESDLQTLLEDFALKNRWLVQDLGELRFDDSKLTKEDLRTPEERSAFISKRGLDAFEHMPRTREEGIDVSTMTGAQYSKLSTPRKSELIDRLGVAEVEKIIARKP
jgi:hypothetical protein